jgi:hypothetical protein
MSEPLELTAPERRVNLSPAVPILAPAASMLVLPTMSSGWDSSSTGEAIHWRP